MVRKYCNREEAVADLKTRLGNMLCYINAETPASVEELKSLYEQNDKAYGEKFVKSLDLRKKIKNSTFFKNHYRKKRNELQSEIDELDAIISATGTALELCEILNVNDTSAFTAETILNDEFVNKVIDYKVEQEKAHNEKVEKTGQGRKQTKYQWLYEEFDESQYPILNME